VTASEQAVKVRHVEDAKQKQWLVARLEGQPWGGDESDTEASAV
jgi:hypothetical protein